MRMVKGKEIKGYSFADGIHWYWGNQEIAVIDQYTSEIEWCVRKFTLPDEVIQVIRDLKLRPTATWTIEAKRISHSVTQGSIDIRINGKSLITFADDKQIGFDGEYHSKYSDYDLGKLVCAAFWHPMDDVYHYSDRAKEMFLNKKIKQEEII